jgi:hypothetical protein
MSAPMLDTPVQDVVTPTAPLASPLAQPQRPLSQVPRPVAPAELGRIQVLTNRALAESAYQLRRIGTLGVTGMVAVVLAATLFLAQNLPQGAAVATLKSQLVRLAPLAKGATAPVSGGLILAALPPRGEAPGIVGKIIEQARASGVDLPRGQYEYVPARDGVAARYRMTFPLHARYPKLRDFMERTLVALPAVAVEGLRIERKNVGDDSVDAELKLAAYVRSEE